MRTVNININRSGRSVRRGLYLLLLIVLHNTVFGQYVSNMGYSDYSFYHQINIGNRGAKTTHPSAYLEIGKATGSNKALLLPRGNKDSVISPAYGDLFYNIPDSTPYWYNGAEWKAFSSGGLGVLNNYPTGLTYSTDTLKLARNGLSTLSVYLPFSVKLNKTDTTGKWITSIYRRGDSVFYNKGGEQFAFKLEYSWPGTSSDYIAGDGTATDLATAVQDIGDTRYSLLGHTHLSADIPDLTAVVRNMFSGDSNINVNNTTGKITFTGTTGGGSADGNNYTSTASFSNNVLTLGRSGLTPLTATWDSTKYHSMGFYDGRYQSAGSYLTGNETISFAPTGDVTGSTSGSTSLAPTLTIGAGKVTNSMLAGSIAISKLSITGTPDGTKYLRDDGTWQAVGGGVADGDKTDITVSSSGSVYTIDNGAVTLAKTTGIEGSFTETTQEFTSSTSMSITLSNTPKSGKAEMYYLNGIVIKASNISRTGTSVTLSGFTRESSDVITAKYSY